VSDAGSRRWVVLVVTLVITTIGIMDFAAVFPLLNLWIRDLEISRAQGGLLSGLWYLPGILIALPAGWAFDRYRIRRVLAACWALIALGTVIMALAPSFWVLCLGRLVFSIGMNAHLIGTPKLIGMWFAGRRELGLIMGIYTMSFTAGVFLALNVLGAIGGDRGWRPAVVLMAVLSAAGLGLITLLPRWDPVEAAPSARLERFSPFALGPGAWVLAIAYFGYSVGTDAYLTFAPDFLVETGRELAVASAMVGFYGIVALVLKPLFSSFLRASTGVPFVLAASLFAILALGLLFAPVPPRVSATAIGVSLALGMPAFFALPAFLFAPERSGRVYGLYQMLYSFGFFAQPLVGFLADGGNGYRAGFALAAGYCVLGLLVGLPPVRRLRPAPVAAAGAAS
jgi:MFS family permease